MPIRVRLALVFALVAAALFSLGGWLFLHELSAAMLGSVDTELGAYLGQASRYLAPGSSTGAGPATPLPGEFLVQVLDRSGRVAGASADAGSAPLLPASLLGGARAGQVAVTTTDEGEQSRTLAAPLAGHPGYVAVASVSLDATTRTLHDALQELLVGGLAFAAVAGCGAYVLARAALSPVDRLRRQAAALSARDVAGRLDPPRTRDEIAALAATMNDLLGRLRAAIDRERAFVADASHELRTPIAVLQGELELAARPGRSREQLAAAVAEAASEAERLGRLANDLLLLARSDADGLPLHRTATDLAALLAGAAAHASSRAARAGVAVRVEASGADAYVDRDRVRQAVDDLVDNALRFAPEGSTVHLRAACDRAGARIEVVDEGPGFPDEFLPRAFERFGRPDSGRARGDGGSGLGLAIVRAIAEAHGGSATADNAPGGGARVRLTIPGAALPSGGSPPRPGPSGGVAPGDR